MNLRTTHLFAAISLACAVGAQAAAKPAEPPPFLAAKGLKVLESKPGPNGTTAWVVTDGKGGAPAVVFTLPGTNMAVAGVIWDAKTGKVLSNGYAPSKMHPAATQINNMRGFVEGQPRPADQVLHVVFDPRCPYCHKLYEAAQPHIKSGKLTVKWLPVVVLGSDADRAKSMDAIAAGFNMGDGAKAMKAIVSGQASKGKPDKKLVSDLIINEQFLRQSYKENPELGQLGVPTAYFITAAGQPVMRKAGDVSLLNQIMQDIKK